MITVFTPTFNRAYTLKRLYESLIRQTYNDFEWLIIDDGSTDETAELCELFMSENRIPIRYYRVENRGKHVAINAAAKLACGEWFFIVDSDDWLPVDSLEVNAGYLKSIENDKSFAGVSGLHGFPDGTINLGEYSNSKQRSRMASWLSKQEYIDATPNDYRFKMKVRGDRAEIVRTSVVLNHPFPVFANENFLAETQLWAGISNDGLKIRWFYKITYLGEYLPDGLSANVKVKTRQCWRGALSNANYLACSDVPLLVKLKNVALVFRYGLYGGKTVKELFRISTNKVLAPLGILIAVMFPIKEEQE